MFNNNDHIIIIIIIIKVEQNFINISLLKTIYLLLLLFIYFTIF